MSTVLERDVEQAIDAAGYGPEAAIALTDATNRALAVLIAIAEDAGNHTQDRIAATRAITDLCAAWLTKD